MGRDWPKGAMTSKRIVVPFVTLVSLLGAASAAWACTRQANMIGLNPQSSPPFLDVIVQGKLGDRLSTPVEIRWNSLDGQLLGTIDTSEANRTGAFAVTIRLPEAEPGVYFILAQGREFGIARAAIEILPGTRGALQGNPRLTASGDLWRGLTASRHSVAAGAWSSSAPAGPALTAGMTLIAVGTFGILAGIGTKVASSGRRMSRRSERPDLRHG